MLVRDRIFRVLIFLKLCCLVCCYKSDIMITDEGIVTRDQNSILKVNRSNGISRNVDNLLEECEDYWVCFTYRMLNNISDIMKTNNFHLTESISLNRIPVHRNKMENEIMSVYDEQKKLIASAGKGYGQLTAALINSTLKLFRTHFLTWNVLPGVSLRVYRNLEHDGAWDAAVELQESKQGSRTFGARRRIMMALLPMMYKMGVMTTMLGGLIILAFKGLTIGVILLLLGFGNFFHKFKSQGPPWYPHHPTDIHVHVHTDGHKQAYSGWHYGPVSADHSEVYGE
ncbi:uncharacterized protein LOC124723016 [Schistocerca piceifrons]|uniref:uncharacterized protein LOC124723016 n=1 Tax=Schistocerca piceifrons TaxID=274613 RepID=UPI001F5FE50A|nr:uncharacterized protein LOC124723016 [Schistocerca piceifrons]